MNILAIGDVHGRDVWKEIKSKEADHIIFIGDYVDPHRYIPDEEVIQNLEEIINFKKQNPGRVTLLIGNHDAQYMYFPNYLCSGFRADLQPVFGHLFAANASLFQIAWQCEKYLFTHAGVSRSWFMHHRPVLTCYQAENLAATLNAVHHSHHQEILFDIGYMRGGEVPYGGPVWADKAETEFDFLAGYHQVVGHSRVLNFIHYGNPDHSITYIDVLDTQVKFYEVSILNDRMSE